MSADLAAAVAEDSDGGWVSGVVIMVYTDAVSCIVGWDEIYVPWFAEDWPSGPPPVGSVVKIDESEGQLRASSLLGTRPAAQVGWDFEHSASGIIPDTNPYRDPATPGEVLSVAADGRVRVQTSELVLRRYANGTQDEGIVLWGRQMMDGFAGVARMRKLRIALADQAGGSILYGRLCDRDGNDVEAPTSWMPIGSASTLYRPGRARAWQLPYYSDWAARLAHPACAGIRFKLDDAMATSLPVRLLIGTYGSLSLYPLGPSDNGLATITEVTDA